MIEEEPSGLQWVRDESGALVPTVDISTEGRSDKVYWVDFRLEFHGLEAEWRQGPYAASGERVRVALDASQLRVHDKQAEYLSNLRARIRIASPGQDPSSVPGIQLAVARAVVPRSGPIILLDRDEARAQAPGGVWDAAERSRLVAAGVTLDSATIVSPDLPASLFVEGLQ